MRRRGFTLIELLVVVLIIGIVSVVALPTVLPALASRQVSEAGRLLQGALAGARDKAIHDGHPSGIRLLPDPTWPLVYTAAGTIDPTQPLVYNRVIPIEPAPEYMEGAVTIRADFVYGNLARNPSGDPAISVPSLVLEGATFDAKNLPNPPTSWSWNVRVGDQLQLNGAGPWYTIVGPMWISPATGGNPEMYVNWGPPGTISPPGAEWLILTNGRDDNGNGWVDEGWDGVDNDGKNGVDDPREWEAERWIGGAARGVMSAPYAIRRRPLPSPAARELALPTAMVIDAARSKLPINPLTGAVDILINPDGTAGPSLPYGVPASLGMGSAFAHFALVNREDVAAAGPPPPPTKGWAVLSLQLATGRLIVAEDPDPANPFLAAMRGDR